MNICCQSDGAGIPSTCYPNPVEHRTSRSAVMRPWSRKQISSSSPDTENQFSGCRESVLWIQSWMAALPYSVGYNNLHRPGMPGPPHDSPKKHSASLCLKTFMFFRMPRRILAYHGHLHCVKQLYHFQCFALSYHQSVSRPSSNHIPQSRVCPLRIHIKESRLLCRCGIDVSIYAFMTLIHGFFPSDRKEMSTSFACHYSH
jgi:hypothetical protein